MIEVHPALQPCIGSPKMKARSSPRSTRRSPRVVSPALQGSYASTGNDVRDQGIQENIGQINNHKVFNRNSIHLDNVIFVSMEYAASETNNMLETKRKGIEQKVTEALPGIQRLFQSVAEKRTYPQELPSRTLRSTPTSPGKQAETQDSSTSRGSSTTPSSNNSPRIQSIGTESSPLEDAFYRERMEWIRVIHVEIFKVTEKGYLRVYRQGDKIRRHWERICHRKPALEQIETLLRDQATCDAIKISKDPLSILKEAAKAAEDVHNLLRERSEVAVSPPKKRKFATWASPGRKSGSKDKTKAAMASSTDHLILTHRLHTLHAKIKELLTACKDLNKKAAWLSNVRRTNHAYTRMYDILQHRCRRRHEVHIVDFDLRRDLDTAQWQNEFHFRFSIPASGGRTWEKEAWLRYQANEQSLPEQIGCLLDLEPPTSDGEMCMFTCVCNTRGPARTLTDLNWILRQEGNVVTEEDVLQLAKKIASAVLGFNCTPWVRSFWTCNDVIMYAITNGEAANDVAESYSLSMDFEPHLRMHLENTADQIDFKMMLSCLGLVLYDLWKYFPGSRDTYEPRLVTMDSDELVSITLGIKEQMSVWVRHAQMPRRYEEIVTWCLNAPQCSLAEMRDPMKMDEMYRTVVCGLDEVIDKERKKSAIVEHAQIGSSFIS
ncbi:hypothetical protein FB567DRAFT_529809 [Paraphoma chrysanthemicola]|uniref:Uncharacterized protein n=1 Tax=Paraphoma chrysanthemicola TaxID=798071 RepID=A0A8K0VXE3_9PLEO|nr:hypothetical protein FB567DRAFT_529809 [Paraphoma chrysanthemicola]